MILCRPKPEAQGPKEHAVKTERTPEAKGNEGMDELMLLAQSRHLSGEPEAQPDAQAEQAASADRTESADPAKSEEVCVFPALRPERCRA